MAVKHNALHQFTVGLNNAPTSHPANVLPFTHPVFQGWKVYYEQFTDGAVRVDDAFWNITALTTGTIVAGSENSLELSSKATTTNSGYIVQRNLADIELTDNTKKFYLETRVKFTHTAGTVKANEWFVGWASDEQATASGGILWDADEILGFGHLDADTSVYFISREDNNNQLISLGADLTTGVYAKFACYFDGTNFNLYKDDSLVGVSPMTELNDDEGMVFQVLLKTGEGKTNTLNVQYALLACEL